MYTDKTLVCKECGQEFIFTAGEAEFYAEKGFVNEPQRCKACRDARKNAANRNARCLTPSVPSVANLAKSPSSPGKTARSTAVSALPREEGNNLFYWLEKRLAKCGALFFVFLRLTASLWGFIMKPQAAKGKGRAHG